MLYFIADFGDFTHKRKPDRNLQSLVARLAIMITPKDVLVFGGDNYYPRGTRSDADIKALEKAFRPIKCPIYGVLGNHDYMGNITHQTNSEKFNISSDVQILEYNNISYILINTPLIHPLAHNNIFEIYNNHHGLQGTEDDFENLQEKIYTTTNLSLAHIENIKSALRDIPIDHPKVMIGHFPLASNGVYNRGMAEFREKLIPIIVEYNVRTYICGHEHNAQVHSWTGQELQQLIVKTKLDEDLLDDFSLCQYICGSSTEVGTYGFKIDDDDTQCIYHNIIDKSILVIDNEDIVSIKRIGLLNS